MPRRRSLIMPFGAAKGNLLAAAAVQTGGGGGGGGGGGAVGDFVAVAHSAFDATSLVLTDSDPVSTWSNEGTTGGDATQATGTDQPTYVASGVNSQPVIRFDGANHYLQTASWTSLAQPNTILAVVKFDDANTSEDEITDGIDSSNRHVLNTGNGEWTMFAGTSYNPPGGTDDSNWHVLVAVYDGVSSKLYVDGTLLGTGNAGSQALTGLTIGATFAPSSYWDGDMHFIGLYDGDMVTDDLSTLNAAADALATRVGITWTDIT